MDDWLLQQIIAKPDEAKRTPKADEPTEPADVGATDAAAPVVLSDHDLAIAKQAQAKQRKAAAADQSAKADAARKRKERKERRL